ncbi:polysaccharide biosynthesis C-terminal domain-containing protein [Pseudoalteromonas sp. APC 3691]|uniref:polysaccharide biosynthesis C-terminal domain-containing protein n=1 Tax=Pseudoalteromonas sp. APC 3691 TaxID=3035173 RepID=UPI0025B4D8FD|nr:polysaccharide biosynthesis C-terminal domain-containing protein [Pseudoalteromonas sp. APC 3691]MDN3389591.1 polysaccharide biosynthesis C-terminal domain-containing protein [Pseudoalteromonas sp. APC 3691]
MINIKSIYKNKSFAAIFSKVTSAFFTFLFLFFITKSISTHEAGVFLYSYSIMMVLVQLARAGTDNVIIKQLTKYKCVFFHKYIMLKISFIVILISLFLSFSLIVIIYFGGFPIYNNISSIKIILIFLVVSLLFSFMQVLASYFQSQLLIYSQYWSLGIGVSFAGCISCLITYYYKLDVLKLSLIFLLMCSLVMLTSIVTFFKYIKSIPIYDKKHRIKKLDSIGILKYTIPFSSIALIMIIIQQGGALLSGFWLNEEQLALISVAFRISTLVGFLFVAFCALLAPRISSHFEDGNISDIHDKSIKQVAISNLFSISLFIFFIFFGDLVLNLFGERYVASYPELLIFSFCWVIRSYVGPVGTILTMTNHLKELRKNLYFSALVILISSIILIPKYGSLGAAISSLVGSVTMCLANSISVKKELNISFYNFKSLKNQIYYLVKVFKLKIEDNL